jgi:hypothetical protein
MQLSIAPSLETAVVHFWGTSRIVQQAHKAKEVRPARKPRGYYVYAWYRNTDEHPFYVGKGSGNRAWVRHLAVDGIKPAVCELVRQDSDTVRIAIVKEAMSDDEALELEEELIADYLAQGVPLANGGTLSNFSSCDESSS